MSPKRLLVVDDELGFREFVVEVAEGLGFQVESAANGAEFKVLFDASQPDVAVVDVIMPGIDGIELVSWLADQATNLRLIMVTGFTPHYTELAKKLGEAKGLHSVTTLHKPVRLATLREAITADD
jgi:CheY-like chemotaxis protein